METNNNSKWSEPTKINYDTLQTHNNHNSAVGEIGEVDPALEEQLYGNRVSGAGDSLAALELNVTVEGPERVGPVRTFADADLHPVVLENIQKCGYDRCTAVQAYSIPAVLKGQDVVAVSQTGSGKTAAYLAPIISTLIGKLDQIKGPRADTRAENYDPEINKVRAEPLVLIVCPTRELAIQIHDETRRIAYRSQLKTTCIYGGTPIKNNLQQLGKGCDILIASPGRLMDMMERQNVISLQRVQFTVIDEADEMLLDTDFSDALEKIMSGCDANENADHRYMMFSATFPKEARSLARQYLQHDYIRIRVGRAGSAHKNVDQEIMWIDRDAKAEAMTDLLFSMEPGLTIVFCNTNAGVERLDDVIYNKQLPTVFLHGGRDQMSREDAIRTFHLGKTPILITSSVVARGIDFKNVKTVINYDMPSPTYGGIAEYVHRIGRTGRMGHRGKAISFYNDNDEGIAQDLVNILLECDQEVPDFLAGFKPDDGQVAFQDDTDDEGDNEGGAAAAGTDGAAWGGDTTAGATGGDTNNWGGDTSAEPAAEMDWGSNANKSASEPVAAW
ncbi:P-loop containing nucleoside triphosphate hydrolase protein [Elsinoe ampelina]|uniref:RNA helicase n=1 Tax=Elsinoe ampelina TaxID=302913 RepID=A0A6A6G4B5_9PEZI|nr:P-loop containing nucleoside triphosphate hydrolase protein [Elsinoe ampelina]